MTDYQLLIDLHKEGHRQGPGGEAETEQALRLAGIDREEPLKVADIGCGTGASTVLLAKLLNARITAVDFLQDFLHTLEQRAEAEGVGDKISTLAASMDELSFSEEELDVIWSEGAIYNIGFEKGVASWRPFLKAGGTLVVSEITWTSGRRPRELQDHWEALYPEIDVASAKIRVLEESGYSPLGYFILPERCWLDEYYRPMQSRFEDFLKLHNHSEQARAIVEAEQQEIALYEKHKAHFSYGMYVARKLEGS